MPMQGFLCPSCFHAFPSADALKDHYEVNHSGDALPSSAAGAGSPRLVCPACKMRLGTETELQSHYARHHTPQDQKVCYTAFEIERKSSIEHKERKPELFMEFGCILLKLLYRALLLRGGDFGIA